MKTSIQWGVGLFFTIVVPLTTYYFGQKTESENKIEQKIDSYASWSRQTDSVILIKIDQLKDTVRRNNLVVKEHIRQNNQDFKTVVNCISYIGEKVDSKNNEVIELLLKEVSVQNKSVIRYLDTIGNESFKTVFLQQNK